MWSQSHSTFWLCFLKRYKEHKCLWSKDSKDFTNRKKRIEAYTDLVCLAKKIEPDADLMFVRRRIDSFRNSFRRQSQKALAARENGFEYQCSAYYYNLLKSFLDPHPDENQDSDSSVERECFSTNFADDDDCVEESTPALIKKELEQGENCAVEKWETYRDPHQEESGGTKEQKSQYSIPRKRFRSSQQALEPDVVSSWKDVRKKQNKEAAVLKKPPDDESELLGQRLASHFQKMKPSQRLLAEKIISDVCIYGRMGKLTLNSGLIVDFAEDVQDADQEDYVSEENEITLHPEAYMNPI